MIDMTSLGEAMNEVLPVFSAVPGRAGKGPCTLNALVFAAVALATTTAGVSGTPWTILPAADPVTRGEAGVDAKDGQT